MKENSRKGEEVRKRRERRRIFFFFCGKTGG